jgi:hypothetical protein
MSKGKPIPKERLAGAREAYIGGLTQREVAKRFRIGPRQLAEAAKKGRWMRQKEARRKQVSVIKNEAICEVQKGADMRDELIEQGWQRRVSGVCDMVGGQVEKTGSLLKMVSNLVGDKNMSSQKIGKLVEYLGILAKAQKSTADTLARLVNLMPAGGQDRELEEISDQELVRIIKGRG